MQNALKILRSTLSGLFVLGLLIVILDGAMRTVRGWQNQDGVMVDGYGLYERQLVSTLDKTGIFLDLPFATTRKGWEFVEFYQWKIGCDFVKSRKDEQWRRERKHLLESGRIIDGPNFSSAKDDLDRVKLFTEWRNERRAKGLSDKLTSVPLYSESDLPEDRYRCVSTPILYRPGMGWGLF